LLASGPKDPPAAPVACCSAGLPSSLSDFASADPGSLADPSFFSNRRFDRGHGGANRRVFTHFPVVLPEQLVAFLFPTFLARVRFLG